MMDDSKRIMKKQTTAMKVDGLNYNDTRHSYKIWNFLPFKGHGFPTRFLFDYYFVVHPNSFLCCVFVCLLVVVVLCLVTNDARVYGLSILDWPFGF